MSRYPRDMGGYGPEAPAADWPGGARIAISLVLNYEEGGENCILHGDAASEAFLSEIVGTDGRFTTDEITNQLRNMVVSRFTNILGQSKIPALDLAGNYDQLGQFLLQRIAPEFETVGLELTNLLVENISLLVQIWHLQP